MSSDHNTLFPLTHEEGQGVADNASDLAIRVTNLSKCYQIYGTPRERLKQFVAPRLQRLVGHTPKQYFREFWALKDISFEVKKGETVGVIGRNGSGKSTLLQLICGTQTPTSGTVETVGRVAALLELGSGFNPDFTGRENIYMNAAVLGLTHEEVDRKFDDIAAFADIGEFIEQPVRTYSSGMIVRLAFSVSVFVEPDILVVDEALAVGDVAFQFKCLDRLKELTSNGTTLLFVSHDMGMVKSFCSHGLYLANGKERARGAPDVIAEYYYLDLRDEQRLCAAGGVRVVTKPFLGGGQGIAFGTEEGSITGARFISTGSLFSSFMYGENVEIEIGLRYRESIKFPSLSVIIHDRKMLAVAGDHFLLDGELCGDGWKQTKTRIHFKAPLAAGRYHITVRLEDRISPKIFHPIDRQVGLLSMEIQQGEKSFLGTVDLGMRLIS